MRDDIDRTIVVDTVRELRALGMHGILVEHPAPAMAELRRLAGLR